MQSIQKSDYRDLTIGKYRVNKTTQTKLKHFARNEGKFMLPMRLRE